jgi:hypothetical protein
MQPSAPPHLKNHITATTNMKPTMPMKTNASISVICHTAQQPPAFQAPSAHDGSSAVLRQEPRASKVQRASHRFHGMWHTERDDPPPFRLRVLVQYHLGMPTPIAR